MIQCSLQTMFPSETVDFPKHGHGRFTLLASITIITSNSFDWLQLLLLNYYANE